MAVFKCKMCGGDIHAEDGAAFGTCDSCGVTSTLPKASDEKLVNLFNRANHFRRQNEFDKALTVYENILNEDNANAEAHWCAVLCRYGIEYVEDPSTHERVPTCHRAQYAPILTDADYLAAIENAQDSYARELYETEAKKINEIQKGILAISNREEPFDVFICYKETTDGGSRTKDSVLAQDIYYSLTGDGYRVFFAKITLEDKLGQEYEPYIFSALNSAKVMLVIGTQKEHFYAVWVKNEWSRFLALMKGDRSRLLIPCYRDMDAYDMPDELANLQALDMSKIGFAQDLLRGVKKVLDAGKASETAPADGAVIPTTPASGISALLKRAFMFLEDGDFKQADEYCERVLDTDPENAKAYLGKLCAELKIHNEADLVNQQVPFDNDPNYQKAIRFADANLRTALEGCIYIIKERIAEIERQEQKRKQQEQERTAAQRRKEQDRIAEMRQREKDEQQQRKKERTQQISILLKRMRKIAPFATGVIAIIIIVSIIQNNVIKPRSTYTKANSLSEQGNDKEAIALFADLGDYKDSAEQFEKALSKSKYWYPERLSAGSVKTIGLKADGTVVAIGSNGGEDQCDVSSWRDIIAVSAGSNHVIGLKADGTVLADGENYKNQCDVSGWRDIVAVSGGQMHTIGLKTDGTVVAAGDNKFGQCDVSNWSDIIEISARDIHTVGLKADGTVVAVGNGKYDVSNWRYIVEISAGNMHTIGLKADGTVVAAGDNDLGQCDVSSWSGIVAVSAGGGHTIGLKSDGTVVAVGYNNYGQCDVSSWSDIIEISAGNMHTIGLKADGTVVAVGYSNDGQCDVSDWKLKVS